MKKPLKGLGILVFGEGGESAPERGAGETSSRPQPLPPASAGQEEQAREREEEVAVRLANAEIERAMRAEREQRGQTLEMLTQMFPGILPPFKTLYLSHYGANTSDLDREVVEAVVVAKEGRVGACIDICLEISSEIDTPIEQPSPPQRASMDNASKRSSEEDRGGVRRSTEGDLLGLDEEDGIAGIRIEDRPGAGGHVDLMS